MVPKDIIIGGLRIHYVEGGQSGHSDVKVFLHGWKSEALHLKSIYQGYDNYIALDWPGFGKSDAPGEPWSISDYAEMLKSFLDKLGIANPVLIGHSFGGSVIIKYCALGYPARKAILIGSSGIREKTLKKKVYKVFAKTGKAVFQLPVISKAYGHVRKKFYQSIDSEDYLTAGALVESYKRIISEDLQEDMKKIKIPVRLIWGEKDDASPLEYGRRMNALINHSRLDIIPGAGHFCFLDKPEEFRQVFGRELAS